MMPPRMAAIWCPDWPVTTVRAEHALPADAPIAVLTANRVVACSHTARQYGIRRGQRKREAQSRFPELLVADRNEAAEARAFEPIVAAIENIAPGVEIGRPGLAAIGIRGPSRYFGGETAVLHTLSKAVGEHTADVLIGVADGAFTAEIAARQACIVDAGQSPQFLSNLPIELLDQPELVDLLKRLGIRTLGAFAALPPADVQARFGPTGSWAHRQAGGADTRPIAARRPPVEFEVSIELEPPLDRVDSIAFTVRSTVDDFVGSLADHGLAATCFELIAQTDRGEESVRRWRHSGILTSVDVIDRVRWQLEGWLSRRAEPNAPSGPVNLLRFTPIETVPTGVHQRALWGGDGEVDERAHRALARVQTLLGHGSVLTPVVGGGRSPAARSRLVPWGDEREILDTQGNPVADQPWPGQLPAPTPSVLITPPRAMQLTDAQGRPVLVTARGSMPEPPSRMTVAASQPVAITAWAGPWPVDERWWDSQSRGQLARLQLVDVLGRAYLVHYLLSERRWYLEAIYD